MRALISLAFVGLISGGTVVDRIAVIVDKRVIKDSDIDREIRVTTYLNGERPTFSPAERRQAAQRLIDQAVIRHEIEIGQYGEASEADVTRLYTQATNGKGSLTDHRLTPDQLRRALRWQLTVLRFIEMRFKPQEALGVKDPFETWLDETRKSFNIQYREEDLK